MSHLLDYNSYNLPHLYFINISNINLLKKNTILINTLHNVLQQPLNNYNKIHHFLGISYYNKYMNLFLNLKYNFPNKFNKSKYYHKSHNFISKFILFNTLLIQQKIQSNKSNIQTALHQYLKYNYSHFSIHNL